MKKLLTPANAAFDFTAKTITFSTEIPLAISHILHVTNVTRGVLYFQPQAGSSYSGTYASPVLTLNGSTAGHADADKLEIFYDDGVDPSNSTLQTSANAKLDNLLTELQLKADLSETQPVSAASLPLPTGAGTESTSIANGVLLGAVNETAPGTDTASSGLNGRLQRIAQRITSLIAQLPSSLGIKTAANSLSVAPASDATFLVDGSTFSVSATFNRPADTTAYAALDTVTDSTSAPTMMSWATVGGSGYITKAHLGTTQSTNVARYRLHLYMATMTNTNDNAAFTVLSGDFANKIGSIDFLACATEGTGSTIAESLNRDIRLGYYLPSGSTIFGRLETLDVFTPASAQTFTIKLLFEKNR